MLQELPLAKPDVLRGHLDQFIIINELQGLFQREAHRRREQDVLVPPGGTDVGQLFALERVHDQVVVAAVNADDHPLVDLGTRVDEHPTSVLQCEQRIRQCRT